MNFINLHNACLYGWRASRDQRIGLVGLQGASDFAPDPDACISSLKSPEIVANIAKMRRDFPRDSVVAGNGKSNTSPTSTARESKMNLADLIGDDHCDKSSPRPSSSQATRCSDIAMRFGGNGEVEVGILKHIIESEFFGSLNPPLAFCTLNSIGPPST